MRATLRKGARAHIGSAVERLTGAATCSRSVGGSWLEWASYCAAPARGEVVPLRSA